MTSAIPLTPNLREPSLLGVSQHRSLSRESMYTSEDYINVSGALKVVDMDTKEIVATIDMGGQPDAVAISPDKTFIAVAIENERDEDLGDGIPPQLPGGYVQIVDSSAEDPSEWTATLVNMTGLEGVNFPLDPEPEFVDINADNIVVVTLQENNAIVLIDCATAEVTKSFSAGTVSLENIDTDEEGIIDASSSLADVPREPDGVTWIGVDYFATANEGDMDGGSRGFSSGMLRVTLCMTLETRWIFIPCGLDIIRKNVLETRVTSLRMLFTLSLEISSCSL